MAWTVCAPEWGERCVLITTALLYLVGQACSSVLKAIQNLQRCALTLNALMHWMKMASGSIAVSMGSV